MFWALVGLVVAVVDGGLVDGAMCCGTGGVGVTLFGDVIVVGAVVVLFCFASWLRLRRFCDGFVVAVW